MKRTSVVVIVALLHTSCAHHAAPAVAPVAPVAPVLPPALKLPPWWPQGLPAPAKEPAWMAYPETWREA